MRVLLHICCAPCACYPVKALRNEDMEIHGFWYNPNIHPYTEYQKRLEAVDKYSEAVELPMIQRDEYDLEGFLQSIAFRENIRCRICYTMRLQATAQVAKHGHFDAFTSTLLYSKTQDHNRVIEVAEDVSADVGIPLLYRDFRNGWQEGITISKDLGLYRQQYCGCVYSEKERYLSKSEQ